MRCAACGHTNRSDCRFCAKCGRRLGEVCAACGTLNEIGERFCGHCGGSLTGTAAEGERRQLTVLFCDLVGSTELSGRLDPEELHDLVGSFQDAAATVVDKHGGHIAQYLGDGVLVYFGHPAAHEDDAERAVRTGLGIVDALRPVNARLGADRQLAVRVGIHTGPVVVSQLGGKARRETLALGETTNVAARVQGVAAPDTVVMSAATQALVPGIFVVEELGAQTLKGVAVPVVCYRVLQPSGVRSRFHARATRGLTALVGREHERQLLSERWQRAREGEGQVVLITGEPGIGKSRLVQALLDELAEEPHMRIECQGLPVFQNTAFHPVEDMLQQGFAWRDDEGPGERVAGLERSLARAGVKLPEAVPLVASLLGIPVPERYPPLLLSAEQKRRRLLSTCAAWVFGAAQAQPMIIVCEDLHWVDGSTLELLGLLAEQGATAPLLLLFTTRPEFAAPWPSRAHHAQITPNRLSRHEARAMVTRVAGDTPLPAETVEMVVQRTDGVPLFVEELTRLVLQRGAGVGGRDSAAVREIPATLEDSLRARIDHLGPAREVAQAAAVIGREFSYALLQTILPLRDRDLQAALDALAGEELIYTRGLPPEATYLFKHALIQEAAYQSLLKSRRRKVHLQIVEALEAHFSEEVETHPEVIAHHYTEAGALARAIPYWQRAGERALERAANAEAINHLGKGLELLESVSATSDGNLQQPLNAQRCALLLALGRAERNLGEFLKAEDTFRRAAEVAKVAQSTEFLATAGLGLVSLTRKSDLSAAPAVEVLKEALEELPVEDSKLKAQVLGALALASGATGAFQAAMNYFRQGEAMARRLDDPVLLATTLMEGTFYIFLGPDHLQQRLAWASEIRRLQTPTSGAEFIADDWASNFLLAYGQLELGDMPAADAAIDSIARYGEELGQPTAVHLATLFRAARALMRGRFEDGERLAQEARAVGARLQGGSREGAFGVQMFSLRREQDRLRELEPVVRYFVQQHTAAAAWRPGLALIYSELGRREDARAEFERLAQNDFGDIPHDAMWIGTMTYLVDVCIFLEDRPRAATLYRLLLPFDGRNALIGDGIVCCGALSRYLGALAAMLARWDEAAHHFEDAMEMNARMEARPWLAHTQHQYGVMLLARRRPGDRDKAAALLNAAQAMARELGMRALEQRTAAAMARMMPELH